MIRRVLPMLVFAIVLAGPGVARAVIFDAIQYVDGITQPGWTVDVSLGGKLQSGNTDVRTIGGAAGGSWRVDDSVLFASVNGGLGEEDNSPFEQRTLEHLRFRQYFNDWSAIEVFGQHEHDRFKRIKLRALAGAGPRFFLRHAELSVAAGVTPMIEHLRIRDDGAAPDAGTASTEARASFNVVLTWQIRDGLMFSSATYIQPRIDDWSDYRATLANALDVAVVDPLSLAITYEWQRDNTPAFAVAKVDNTAGFELRLAFSGP